MISLADKATSIEFENTLPDISLANSMFINGIAFNRLNIYVPDADGETENDDEAKNDDEDENDLSDCNETTLDSEALSSNENDASEIKNSFVPDPRRYGLTDDYVYVEQDWGSLFYKYFGKQKRSEAKRLCSHDGAHLPIPRFAEENEFYRTHFGHENIWLDVENYPDEGLKTVDGHFYMRHIRSFTEKPSWMDESYVHPVTDVSIKYFDWVDFSAYTNTDIDTFPLEDLMLNDDDIDDDIDDIDFSLAVIMAKDDHGWNNDWMLAYENELVGSVCVYNIKPDESCSKCLNEKFCRFIGSERDETECVCPKTTKGEHCEVDLCSQCQNGGSCEMNDETNKIECRCPYPFYGANCESSSILLMSGESSMIINSLGQQYIKIRLYSCIHGC